MILFLKGGDFGARCVFGFLIFEILRFGGWL
jgi:hypothetical protein